MKTLKAGLIGDHISQTRLPAALGLMCEASGIDLVFELIDTADRTNFNFDRTVDDLRAAGWTGVTVTHPYKTDAGRYAGDGMQPDVSHLGASNTLLFGDPTLGFNTDFTGFLSAWRSAMGDRPVGTVAMAGAGGVARALGPALVKLGADQIMLWDSAEDRANDLVKMIGPRATSIAPEHASEVVSKADGLVNATPVGMNYHPGSAFPADGIGPQSWAFDAVYTPTDTEFLRTCQTAGLQVLSGFDLFRHMALRSFQAYTGIVPDAAHVLPMLDSLRPK